MGDASTFSSAHQRAANFEEISAAVAAGTIDTVIVALTDMQGRLQGKRLHAPYFVDEVVRHGTEACNYLLAVDIDMNTVDGYALTSWESGYGDFVLVPDPATTRMLPWNEGTALVLADVQKLDGTPVAPSPRQLLKAQLARAAERGWTAYAGTELEFIVFEDSYEQAWDKGYRGLIPANRYNVDYSVLGTSRIEPLLRDIRLSMAKAGMTVESAKGECNPGQHEIAFLYKDALTTCDQHVLFAPNVNSYKRYQDGSFAPTTVAWGVDNRTCALRLVGHGPSLRVECRVPGGDVNPYLAISGLMAAALRGIEQELPLPAPVTGNAYGLEGATQVPRTLGEAAELWSSSALAADAFGPEVVAHYANMARVELDSYNAAVTDWELRRCFERL
jgi:glutamine synthetase